MTIQERKKAIPVPQVEAREPIPQQPRSRSARRLRRWRDPVHAGHSHRGSRGAAARREGVRRIQDRGLSADPGGNGASND